MSKKLRLDQLLVEKGLFASREQARRAVMAGDVKVGTQIAAKPSQLLEPDATIALKPTPRYVGRGALKLESALDHFNINVHGKTALDVGASTGGFTDCLLQRGAATVYAVDVGSGGIVRDPALHQRARDKIVAFVTNLGHIVTGIVPSAIKGADGNQEFFACLRKRLG